MKTCLNKINPFCFVLRIFPMSLLILLMTIAFKKADAQVAKDLEAFASNEYQNVLLPLFFEKEPPVGSKYITGYWMKGAAELINHKTIPTKEKISFFNFDKSHNALLVADSTGKINLYHGDSVVQFILLDSMNKTYVFKIVPFISESFFLQPLTESNKGYSLFKRIVTKLAQADYQSYGYAATGVKHDTYTDFDEYYLLFPDKITYKKFYLNETSFKKVFKPWSAQTASFANEKGNINEVSLIQLVELINKGIK